MRSRHLVLALASALGVGPAVAQELALIDPDAKVHLDAGARYFTEKQYASAVAEFEAGYRIEPDTVFLFAWAQAERLRGNCIAAAPLYRKTLASRPSPQQEVVARHHLAACQALLPTPWYVNPVGDTLVLAGLAGLGAGTGLFFTSAHANDSAQHAGDYRTFHDDIEAFHRQRIGAIVSISLGVGLATAGVLALSLDGRRRKHPKPAPVEPAP